MSLHNDYSFRILHAQREADAAADAERRRLVREAAAAGAGQRQRRRRRFGTIWKRAHRPVGVARYRTAG